MFSENESGHCPGTRAENRMAHEDARGRKVSAITGSMSRTAYLRAMPAGVQLIYPLFNNGCQWWVSGGVVAGCGWSLWRKLRQTMSAIRG